MTQKMRKVNSYIRAGIQLVFFLLFPSAFTAAFAGVKYIFTQIGIHERIGWTAFVAVLVTLVIYTIVFGRFFCGYACAFGSFGDALHSIYIWSCKKRKKKPVLQNISWFRYFEYVKYLILFLISGLCFAGMYQITKGTSPWEVFSMLRAGNLSLKGYGVGILLLILIVCGMFIWERFFCRFLCPMGAVFSILPVLPFFSLKRSRENCVTGCFGCSRVCPGGLELPDEKDITVSGECFMCQKCMNICPKQNIDYGVRLLRGREIWFTVFRALLLSVLFFILGI